MDEKQRNLPPGWLRAPLSEVIQPRGEKVSPSDYPSSTFIGMDHVEAHTTRIVGGIPASSMKSAAARFQKGDILYGRLRPYLNKVAQPQFDGLASAEFIVFPDTQVLRSVFLKYRLNASDFVSFASHLNEGDRPRVSFDQIGDFDILVPPTNEQVRIVAKVEELFSELDKGVESLKTAREQLKVYRQAVLKHAFEGKLTAQWREENKDKLETADKLLARIKQEREARYQQQLEEWEAAVKEWEADGKQGKKPARPKKLRNLSQIASEPREYELWPKFELGDVLTVSSGCGLTANDMRSGQYPVYGGNGICGYHDEYFLEDPTLVIGRVGAKCGVTHITKEHSWITDNALIVSPLIRSFDQRFFRALLEFLNLNTLGSSTGQPVISGSKIYPVFISFPSYEEQSAIADRLDKLQTTIDATSAEIEVQLTRCEALRQSILKKAFSGQLVGQNSNDEPASDLLERIKTEKSDQEKNEKKKKRKDAA